MIQAVLQFAIDAHTVHNERDAYRKFDGKTPFWIHPVGIATAILNDAGIPYYIREKAAIVALLHDVIEDTSADINRLRPCLGEEMFNCVYDYVKDLTCETSLASQQKFMDNPCGCSDICLLVRIADIIDNMQTYQTKKYFPYVFALQKEMCERGVFNGSIWHWRLKDVINLVESK